MTLNADKLMLITRIVCIMRALVWANRHMPQPL